MAWNDRWTIEFKSYLGTDYVLHIQEEDYDDDPVSLTGADNPFETQEDSDADPLKPVRGQTGKINIVTNNPTLLQDMMPENDTQRRVVLTTNGNTVWLGFLSSAAYSQPMEKSYTKVTIPVKSVLTVLDSIDFDGYYGDTVTIAEAIHRIFLKAGMNLSYMRFQTELTDILDYLHSKVCLTRFYSLQTFNDDNGTYQRIVPQSCFSVLASLMKTFGFCIRERNGAFHVVSNIRLYNPYTSVITERIYNFAQDVIDGSNTSGKLTIPTDMASDDNKVTFNPGAKDVTVSLSVSDDKIIDTGEPGTPYSTNPMYGGNIERDGEVTGVTYAQAIDNPTSQRRQLWTEQFFAKNQTFNKRNAGGAYFSSAPDTVSNLILNSAFYQDVLTHESGEPESLILAGTIGCCLCRSGEGSTFDEMQMSPGLLLNCINAWAKAKYYQASGRDTADDICYTLTSNNSYVFTDGYIHFEIDYKRLEYYQRGYVDKMKPNVEIRIGDYLINAWTPYHVTESHPLSGRISITLRGGYSYTSEYEPESDFIALTFIINSLRLYWTPRAEAKTASQEGENNYQLLVQRNFSKSQTVSLEIGTDNNNKPSVSMLMDEDFMLITSYNFGPEGHSYQQRPELYLASLMQFQYTNIRKVFSSTFRLSTLPNNPAFPYTDGQKTYMAVVDKNQWRQDLTTLRFIQTAYN